MASPEDRKERAMSRERKHIILRFAIFAPMLIALYYHIKHLIIKDIEGGIVRSIRLYNLIGVINCVAMFVEWFTGPGTLTWYISMFLYILVTLTILPALEHGVRKWRTYRPVK